MRAPQVDDQSELEISPLMRCGYLLLIKERLKEEIIITRLKLALTVFNVYTCRLPESPFCLGHQSGGKTYFSCPAFSVLFFTDLILGQWSVRCVVALTSNQRTLCLRKSL